MTKKKTEEIQYATGECFLGLVLIAVSEKGLCAVFFGDCSKTLISELKKSFPKVILVDGDSKTEDILLHVIEVVSNPIHKLRVPLDLRGTPFQLQIWKALQEIPVGTTTTYTDIAKKVGKPKSVRAVGSACGSNLISVVIPCHRVIRKDRNLAGYRWLLERKSKLLQLEKKDAE